MAKQNEIYKKWPELEAAIRYTDPKHVKLTDQEGDTIVPFNTNVNKISLTDNIKKIQKKLATGADGVYIIIAQPHMGKNVKRYQFLFGKGAYSLSENIPSPTPPTARERNESALSVDKALENVEKSARSASEAEYLKRENVKLEKEITELKEKLSDKEAEIKSLESKVKDLQDANDELNESLEEEDEEENKAPWWMSGLQELAPQITPVLDRFFDIQEKKLKLEETKFLSQNGQNIHGAKRSIPVNNGSRTQRRAFPRPGEPEWDQVVNDLSQLSDGELEASLEKIQANVDARIYNALYNELYADDGEMSEEEEQNED